MNARTVLVRTEGPVSTNQAAMSANASADSRGKIAKMVWHSYFFYCITVDVYNNNKIK